MNRERILFVAVLAILGLWFLLRSPQKPSEGLQSPVGTVARGPVLPSAYTNRALGERGGPSPFQQPTNVRPHPRPIEALDKPKPFDLPNIWPPTSRSVSIDRYDQLRRDAAAPQSAAAQITIPKAEGEGGGGGGVTAEERVDTWRSRTADQKGRVTAIGAGGTPLKEPPQPWPFGAEVLKPKEGNDKWKFLRALVLLPDPDRADSEGVKEVWAKPPKLPDFHQAYPDEINGFQIATEGRQQGYLRGLKLYLDVLRQSGEAHEPRVQAGQALLDLGLKEKQKPQRDDYLNWSLAFLDEARTRVAPGNQEARRTILLLMLRAAGALNDHERVLRLAVDHLDAFPDSPEVLENVGDVLASRTFSLAPFAIEFFKRASDRASAQRRTIEEMVREGRFDEANALIRQGRAGAPGPEQDLLRARVALALGELDNAAALAGRHATAGGAVGAEALQLIGGVAYTKGDAKGAAQQFEEAAKADPFRSTAFSDWGLALAVQGRTEDAFLCFDEALRLDPVDNSVTSPLGRAYLKLAAGEANLRAAADAVDAGRKDPKLTKEKTEEADRLRAAAEGDFAAAAEMLVKLQDANRSDLLVRYMLAYAKERTGSLKEAADLYRATIDGDSRYLVAIARLGGVQSQLALGESRQEQDFLAAVAHLSKAVELSPQEAVLPYVLARFLMIYGEKRQLPLADRMFEQAGRLPVAERNGNLPLWADLGRACLAYADETKESVDARRLLNSLRDRIRDKMPAGTQEPKLMEHEVYRAGTINLQIIEDNDKKTDRFWDLTESKPPDWKYAVVAPMEIRFEAGKGIAFAGTINLGGGPRSTLLRNTWMKFPERDNSKDQILGGTFWEVEVAGTIPAGGDEGEFAVGLVQPPRGEQVLGVSVKRKRTGNLELRIDGGDRPVFKNQKEWIELKSVPWPAGDFRLKMEVVPEYGRDRRRAQGRFRLLLNGEDVFKKEFGDAEGERASIFSQGKASQVLELYLWVEGRDGAEVKETLVKAVTLTAEQGR